MRNFLYLLVVCGMVRAALLPAHAAGAVEPDARPAILSPIAAEAVLMAVARAGNRVVAVGERGIVLLSDDSGRTWRQAKVPVSVTLTAVTFPNDRQGWVTGHYGVVLHSDDGGETWVRQLDGVTAGKLALQAARVGNEGSPAGDAAAQYRLAEAQRLEQDGPDKPFLDLHFADEKTGFVVGAYNLMFRTEDGGSTWHYWGDRLDNPGASHLYAIAAAGDDLYLAGEQGLVLRSGDGGKSFVRLETPYKGSYFALAALASGEIVIAGLRGNAYRSANRGADWEKVATSDPVTFSGATLLRDGTLLLVNQAGRMHVSRDRGRSFAPLPIPPLPPVNGVAATPDGGLVAVGMRGATRLPPTSAPGNDRGDN